MRAAFHGLCLSCRVASRFERTVLTPFFSFSRHDRRHGRTYVSLFFPLWRRFDGALRRGRRMGGAMMEFECPVPCFHCLFFYPLSFFSLHVVINAIFIFV